MGYYYTTRGCLRLREKWKGKVNHADIQRMFRAISYSYKRRIDVAVSHQVLPYVHISYCDKWSFHHVEEHLTLIAEFFNGFIEIVGEDFLDDGRLYRIEFNEGKIVMTCGRVVYDGMEEEIEPVSIITENAEKILRLLKMGKLNLDNILDAIRLNEKVNSGE